MEILNSLLSFTAITVVITVIIKGISLITKPNIERQLLLDEQKIVLHIFQFVILTILCTIFIFNLMEFYTGDKISNYKDDKELTIQILSTGLVLGFLLAYLIYSFYSFVLIFSKKYYIEHEKHGKLFLIKSFNSERVLLSNFTFKTEDRFFIMLKKEEVLEHKIFMNIEKKITKINKINKNNTKVKS